jgi:hypothetical protein
MEMYRDTCVNRQNLDRGLEDPIRLSFIDKDGFRVTEITRKEARCISSLDSQMKFYFQDGNGFQREMTIDCIEKLTPQSDLVPSSPSCGTAPQPCGPPKVQFFGGQGVGALANVIVSPSSTSIIGFDILNPGKNYLDTPIAEIVDECLNGTGSKLKVNMEDDDSAVDISPCLVKSVRGTLKSNGTFDFNTNKDLCSSIEGSFNPSDGSCPIKGTLKTKTKKFKSITRVSKDTPGVFIPNERPKKKLKKVKNIVIQAPGNGYLAAPDGSLGGNGRVWKRKDEGYAITCSGGYYVVPVGVGTGLNPDDTYIPPNPVNSNSPNVTFIASKYRVNRNETFELLWKSANTKKINIQPILGDVPVNGSSFVSIANTTIFNLTATGVGGTSYRTLTVNVSAQTDPRNPPTPPTPTPTPPNPPTPLPNPNPNPAGTYKVILCLDDIEIEDGGFNYKPGDKVKVIPENGTEVEATINDNGVIIGLKILNKGCGYTDLPQVIVESETGYNATFYPVLKATRIINEEDFFNVPLDVPLVSVVDCIGVLK